MKCPERKISQCILPLIIHKESELYVLSDIFNIFKYKKQKNFFSFTINDNGGKHIKNETLFLNIYDYRTNFHITVYFLEKPEYLFKLERNIGRKCKTHLPNINIFFKRVKDMDRQFSPVLYLNDNDCEKYFEKLLIWKESNEKDYLLRRPFLAFEPYRHEKAIAKSYRKTCRG